MRKYLLAATAFAVIATPAMARDGAGYFGVEGGILFPRKNNNGNVTSVTTTSITPAVVAPATTSGPAVVTTTTTTYNGGFANSYKRGLDLDAIAGFDFGFFRLEGELGYKRTRQKDFTASSGVLTGINTAPFSGVTSNNFVFAGNRTTVLSGMVNGLVDFGVAPGVSLYAGGGVGRARVKTYGDRDNAWAWQLIAGASTALSPNIDLGLKYRYFQTGRLNFDNVAQVTTTGTVTGATGPSSFSSVYSTSGNKFRSHSLLASLIFNFGGTEAAPPPPPPPVAEVAPPPPPPPPATQTCPDGSVIDATATCPVPPPPPPPPPARGERG